MSGFGNKGKILVVGGGISGLTAAIEATEAGCEVILVDKNPYLGGRVAQTHQYFPKLCPPACGLEINLRRVRVGDRLHYHTMAELISIEGEPGAYKAKIKQHPRYVNDNCTACGACVEVCPVDRDNDFNWGMDETKAIYLPFGGAFPQQYVIDMDACQGTSCSKCVKACDYDAIDLSEQESTFDLEVDAVVLATGWQPYDATRLENLGFGRFDNVINNAMMERLSAVNGPTKGRIKRPSDGKEPKSVAFVQCAGSRDENHLAYCSGVCCMASLKQTTYLREQNPKADIYVFYIDIRTPGRLEDFYQERQEDKNLSIIKGKVAKIEEDPKSGDLILEVEDILGGGRIQQQVEMVVLATGMVPTGLSMKVPGNLQQDEYGFFLPEQAQPGVLVAGCAKRPVEVAACVRDATGMALKALQNCM